MESEGGTKAAQRGIALPLVLAVLVCLLAIAVPFALSMRHEQGGAAWRGADADVRREAASVRDLALAKFAAASESDTTRWSDPPDRMKVDVEAAARSLGIADLGPRARLLSGSLDDQAGRVDLNRAPLFLMAKVLGLESHLARKLTPDDKEIHLVDGDFLQDEGFLWIDGEVTYYKHREGATVRDFTRPAIVPGVWEPAKMSGDPSEFEAGTAVVDMRAWMAAAWVWKSPEIARPGAEARFESPTHAFAIASFGRGAFGEIQRERIERYATIFSADADRKRFGNPQRVLSPLVGGTTAELRIEQGQFAGPGSLCRVTTFERKVDYGFVRKVDLQDDGAKLTLEMPLLVTADPGQAVAEFLAARPVNVNSCSPELLRLLLTGLKLRGRQIEVEEKTADLVATRMVGARPFNGMKEFMALLDVLVEKEKVLKDEQRLAILLNAENSASAQIEGGTAPFCWASDGVVEVRAAASRNYPLTGKEKARAFVRDVVDVGGVGRTTRLFATQRDFEQPWWSSRMARGWTSFPENLDVMDGPYGAGAALPPGRLPAMLAPHSRFPAEDLNSTGARLAASRMYGFGVGNGIQFDKTWHFAGGRGDWDSTDPDGWRVSDGPQHVAPNGDENGVQISINVNPYGVERPRPFGVSMWWTPGKSLGTDQTLFDWRCNGGSSNPDAIDRVHLQFKASKLVFEVDDAFRRDSSDDKYSSRIVYDFSDGLALEGDTWYHVTAFCRGDRGGQMCLWVDGRPRGKWSHLTRTTSAFDAAAKSIANIAIDGKRLADGTTKFPSQGAVIVGGQVVEYTGISGNSLTTERDVAKRFGGVRPAPPPDQSQVGGVSVKKANQAITNAQKAQTQHPAQSVVELYGYSGRLASDIPAGSATLDTDGLGKFGVAMIDPKSAKVQLTLKGDQGPPIPLGQGIENDAQEIELLQLDSNKLQASDKAFQKNGGYALVVSYEWTLVNVQDPNDKKNDANMKDLTPLGSIVGGAEVIFYEGFNGTKLTGVTRGQGLAQELGKTEFGSKGSGDGAQQGGEVHYLEKHAWLLTPSGIWTNYKPKFFTVLVIPIGVRVPGSNQKDHFLDPIVRGDTHFPELLQIDVEFDGSFKNETEWVRYNAIIVDRKQGTNFLRTALGPIGATRWWLQLSPPSGDSSQFNGNQGSPLYEIANAGANGSGWAPNGTEYKKLIEGINYEQLDPLTTDPNRLAFRGVLGTVNSEHAGSAKLLPVFRLNRRSGRVVHDALPGRYDEITVVSSPDLPTPSERFIVNYAWCGQYCEGWQIDQFSHVALLDQAPSKRVLFTKRLDLDFSDPKQAAAQVTNLADSRNFARILKHPSGELPNQWDGASSLAIGGDANASGKSGGGAATPGGGGGDGGGKVDEVRVFGCADPESTYPQSTYFLSSALEAGEESRMLLAGDALRVAHGTLAFGIPNGVGLHGDACVVQLGDDFVECGDRQAGLPMTQNIAENGRHVFVTDPAYHSAGEPLQVLPWLVQSRLSSPISATESRLSIADGMGFPHRGYVMIDQEILAYTDLASGDGGVQLYCPSTMHAPGTGSTQRQRGEAVFRGRFGTGAQPHAADAIVTWWPNRYDDGYAPRCDIPEMASLELPVAARRALFHSVVWRTQPGDAGPDLVLTARVMGRGHFAADTDTDPDLFFFEQSGTPEKPNLIDRQGDLLLLRFNVRYRAGVLNLTDFTGNGWKRAPLLQTVGVDFIADRVTELHEESR